ncbi:MAG: YeeE/YedE thiosulfate transporter family protein [Alphaproteobacteria bacterium]
MTVFSSIVVGILMGIAFGFLIEKGRIFEPGYIVGQMQLRKFIMLKVFLTAVATGLIVISIMYSFGLVKLHPKALMWGADVIGGLLLGIGVTIAGACPGTILAQVGVGYKDAWFSLLGGLTGAAVYIYLEPSLTQTIFYKSLGKITLADLTGIPFAALALPIAGVIFLGLYFLEKKIPWQSEIGDNADGVS